MAFTKGNQPLAGYPQPQGEKIKLIFDHTGPASYTQFTTPTTGGDVINASDVGQGGFDELRGGVDTTGQFICYPILYLGGYANAVPKAILAYYALVTATLGGQSQTIGTQVAASTDLSGFSFRLEAQMV